MNAATEIIENIFKDKPLDLYDYILRGPFCDIYTEFKKTHKDDCRNYSSLLIDKFAIHSASFFHLSKGIIEHQKSGEQLKMSGYDIFTVNAIFRTIMETYATFHNIFVEPSNIEEKKFRFLLWKIDGLTEKSRFNIDEKDFSTAKSILENDKIVLNNTITEFESCIFFRLLTKEQINKIYNPANKKYCWRFIYSGEEIKPLNITKLIAHVFKTRAFINTYRYTSIHTHSNYYAIEEFSKIRGKLLPNEYTDPLTRLAIMTTAMLIDDICLIDNNAKQILLPIPVIRFIKGISQDIKTLKP